MNASFQPFDPVARRLPFDLAETHQVNAAFRRWRRQGCAQAGYVVELWTYCFVQRYFLAKFRHRTPHAQADVDALVERAHAKVAAGRRTLREDGRYASWVSVVCKHTFLNYTRIRRAFTSFDEAHVLPLPGDAWEEPDGDESLVAAELHRAVHRLPAYLQEIAGLYLACDGDYDAISRLTGKPVPTVRAYVSKLVARFREDPRIQALR